MSWNGNRFSGEVKEVHENPEGNVRGILYTCEFWCWSIFVKQTYLEKCCLEAISVSYFSLFLFPHFSLPSNSPVKGTPSLLLGIRGRVFHKAISCIWKPKTTKKPQKTQHLSLEWREMEIRTLSNFVTSPTKVHDFIVSYPHARTELNENLAVGYRTDFTRSFLSEDSCK